MAASEQALIGKRPPAKNGVRIKTIALPAEHGGWGLLFEPIVLGLLLAPSIAGLYLALSAVGLFLARHPLTLLMVNRRRPSPRTRLAKQFAAFYLIVAGLTLIEAVATAQYSFALPLLVAAPMALVQVAHDWTGRRRVLLPKIAGAVAILSLAPAIALADGWSNSTAFALWAIMVARAVPAILYVRASLARLHNQPASPLPMLFAHVLSIGAMAWLASAALAPRLVIVVMIVLLLRAAMGFVFAGRRKVAAKQLGFSEVAFGALTVFAVVLGRTFEF
jgi:hypothetical protein